MSQHTSNWLLSRIEKYIAKYYQNKLIQGFLIVFACVLIYLILFLIGEYFFYFSPTIKLIGWLVPGTIALYAIVRYIIIPLLQMNRLGKRMQTPQAAKLIGIHFPEIGDKLLNILELKNQPLDNASKELIEASIEQKSQQLAPYQFASAIDVKKNKKWLPLFLFPLIIGGIIYWWNPAMIKQSSSRLLQPTTTFSKPAPFQFLLINNELEISQYQDLELKVKLEGDAIPTSVALKIKDELIPMKAGDDFTFSYLLKKIDQPIQFQFEAAGYLSDVYTIRLIEQPALNEGKIILNYPSYTGRSQEVLLGWNDITVPEGTQITFVAATRNTNAASLVINDEHRPMNSNSDNHFEYNLKADEALQYYLYLQNEKMPVVDNNKYNLQVVQDQSPTIEVKEVKEEISKEQILLLGSANDDYGLSKASFSYLVLNQNGKMVKNVSIPLSLTGKLSTTLEYYFDIRTLNLQPGEKVQYYMEVWDNDAINGNKRVRSTVFEYKTVALTETDKAIEENNEAMSQSLSAGKEKMKELEEQLKKMQQNTMQDKELSAWEKQQNLDLLQEQQEVFKEKLEELDKRLEKQKELIEQMEFNENIQEKQEAVQKQIDNLLNKELSEQMKRLQELLQKKNGAEMKMQDLQKMQQENSLFQMDMERIEAMIQQLETQMKMEELAEKMNDLAERQEQLDNKTSENTDQNASLIEEQKKIKEELEKLINQDLSELKKKASDQNLSQESEDAQGAKDDMGDSQESLENNQNAESKKSQKSAINKLKKLSKSLGDKAAGMDMEQLDLDIKATRQLLTNLLRLSFEQESLIQEVKNADPSAESFKSLVRDQFQLQKGATLIKDSLFALSKRVVQLGPSINKETIELENKLKEAVAGLEQRKVPVATVNQQYAMTSSNNLALMLNELLSNLLNQQMQMEGSGSGSGKGAPKPGKGKGQGEGQGEGAGGAMKDIITGQQKMGKGFNQLKKEAQEKGQGANGKESGGKDGGQGNEQGAGQSGSGGNDGNGGSGGQGGNNGKESSQNSESTAEILSRMAYEQSKLRQQVQQLNSLLNSKGIKGNAQIMKELLDQMDRMETDIINRKSIQELEKRQNEILTRLLKAEEAIREQEQDNKRQGEQAVDKPRPMPPALQRQLEQFQKMKEMYRTTPPELKPFYKKIAENYMQKVSS